MSSRHPLRALAALLLVAALGPTACAVHVGDHRSPAPSQAEDRARIVQQVDELLKRYAANDADGVLALVDREFVVYGSDVAEVVRTPAQLRQMMADDFALWRSARFGAVRDLDLRVQGRLATAYFQAPFSAGGGPELTVRFSTTWRKDGERWLLTQSANTVPTVGSSAAELLKRR